MAGIWDGVRSHLWRLRGLGAWPGRGYRFLRLVVRSFVDHRCPLLAASLAYNTVLSIVPFLAVAFSVSKGLGIQNTVFIRDVLLRVTAGREDIVDAVIGYINNTHVGTLGAASTAMLVFTAVFLVQTVENILNIIWGAREQEGFWRKSVQYAAMILLVPLFVLAGISATAALQASSAFRWAVGFQVVGEVYQAFLALLPFLLNWVALFLLYKLLPNARVSSLAAMGGSMVAGSLWQAVQWLYVRYQFGVTGYNAIYGSFAQIPILLVWLYITWVIVLLGAELSHAIQTVSTLSQEVSAESFSQRDRHGLAILVLLLLAKNFLTGEIPTANEDMARLLGAPLRLVNSLLRQFADRRMVARMDTRDDRETYILSRPPEQISVGSILEVLDSERGADPGSPYAPEFDFIETIRAEAATAEAGRATLPELLARHGAGLDAILKARQAAS